MYYIVDVFFSFYPDLDSDSSTKVFVNHYNCETLEDVRETISSIDYPFNKIVIRLLPFNL